MFESPRDSKDDRRGIQSIEVGFALIRALARAPGKMTLKSLAAAAGMTPSKAHLYLVSFIRLGLVVQDEGSSRYGLGPAAIDLGLAAMKQLDLVSLAQAPMDTLIEAAGVSLTLSIWGNRGPTIIHRRDGDWQVPLSVRVGFVLPLLSTATGRVFLAHLPEWQWSDIARAEEAAAPGHLERARALAPQIREEGLSYTESAMIHGIIGISAPIFGADGLIRATLTALGLVADTRLTRGGNVAVGLRAAAQEISHAMGARPAPG